MGTTANRVTVGRRLLGGLGVLALILGTAPLVAPARAGGVTRHHGACSWADGLSSAARALATYQRMDERQRAGLIGLARTRTVENSTTAYRGLCIGPLHLGDGPNGVTVGRGEVALASQLSLGATFDPTLAVRYGEALGSLAKRSNLRAIQGPGLDVGVFAGWGRNFENFGDSPGLDGLMGAAEVSGIQSTGTVALVKHVGPYTNELSRNTVNHIVSTAVNEDVYLYPFREVAPVAGAMMCAVGRTNGVVTCANPQMYQALRSMGFAGLVRSDMGAAPQEMAAINAGIDLIKPYHVAPVLAAMATSAVARASVRRADLAILTSLFHQGRARRALSVSASYAVNNQTAEESMVLLANNGTLPLAKGARVSMIEGPLIAEGGGSSMVAARAVGVTGALARSTKLTTVRTATWTPWRLGSVTQEARGWRWASLTGGGTGNVDVEVSTSHASELTVNGKVVLRTYSGTLGGNSLTSEVLLHWTKGSRARLTWRGPTPRVRATYYDRAIQRAVRAAKRGGDVVVFAGEASSEGMDRTSLSLPGYQNQLIEALARVNHHVVVVVSSGGAVLMPWLSQVAAVVEAWYPGQSAGTAVARVLTGAVDPSGRLPLVFPANDQQWPRPNYQWPSGARSVNLNVMGTTVGQEWYDAHHVAPMFRFGYGLSYTTFTLGDGRARALGGGALVSVHVTNTGRRAGRDVVEVYTRTGGLDALAGVGSITLKPGTSGAVGVDVAWPHAWINGAWRAVSGPVGLVVGQGSGHNLRLDWPTGGVPQGAARP